MNADSLTSGRPARWAAAFLLLAAVWPLHAAAEVVEEIAARINDSIITRSELQTRRAQIARDFANRYQGQQLETILNKAQDDLLFDMINEELLIQQAKLNFDMERYFGNLKKQFMKNNDISADADLQEMLEGEGMTQDEFRRLLLRTNVPQDVLQFEVARRISVSPEEQRAYYDAHLADFRHPGEVMLREIVILEEPRGREAARALMDQVVERVHAGESFASLAEEFSESPSRQRGGLTGPFKSGDLAPALEDQAFRLKVGEVGEAVATSYGLHLLKVEKRTESRTSSFEEVQEKVEQLVRRDKYRGSVDEYLKKLWRENRVVVSPAYATGRLEDGGPYADRSQIVPSVSPMGPQAQAPGTQPSNPPPAGGKPGG